MDTTPTLPASLFDSSVYRLFSFIYSLACYFAISPFVYYIYIYLALHILRFNYSRVYIIYYNLSCFGLLLFRFHVSMPALLFIYHLNKLSRVETLYTYCYRVRTVVERRRRMQSSPKKQKKEEAALGANPRTGSASAFGNGRREATMPLLLQWFSQCAISSVSVSVSGLCIPLESELLLRCCFRFFFRLFIY